MAFTIPFDEYHLHGRPEAKQLLVNVTESPETNIVVESHFLGKDTPTYWTVRSTARPGALAVFYGDDPKADALAYVSVRYAGATVKERN